MERKYYHISGYWKDDGSTFSDLLVTNYDDVGSNKYLELAIFYYGLSEEDLKEAILHGADTVEDFVITNYKEVTI